MTSSAISIDAALSDDLLLGAALGSIETWSVWLSVLKAAFGIELDEAELDTFHNVAGSRKPPAQKVCELYCIIGRRGGKSRAAAAVAVYIAAFEDHRHKLSAGELGYILCLSPTLAQSRLVFGYCQAFLESSPILRQKIVNVTATEITLKGDVVISTHPASFRSVRGRAILAAIFDESSFWRSDESALPDIETYRACLPSLAATGGMLISISSPYRKMGLLYSKWRDYYGKGDPEVLVVQGATETFNPTISKKVIARAMREDPAAAASEWGGDWRSDLSGYLSEEVIEQAVDRDRPLELPPLPGKRYRAFVDASGGRGDDYCLCIGHLEERNGAEHFVVDVLRGAHPPFNPNQVAAEFAALVKQYRCTEVCGDNYSAEFVSQSWRANGLDYIRSRLTRSALYLEAIPHFMRGGISMPAHDKLIRQLQLLERQTQPSGKDQVQHPKHGHDDWPNALVGALNMAVGHAFEDEQLVGAAPIFFVGGEEWPPRKQTFDELLRAAKANPANAHLLGD